MARHAYVRICLRCIVLIWAMVIHAAESASITDVALVTRAAALREQLGDGFTVLVERPFVVVGDEDPAQVRKRIATTVRWGVEHLRRDFFTGDPDAVYAIYLFRDEVSYETNALRLIGEHPTSRFGYCSPAHHALVMNIATGGGTLLHEMVHAYMHGNVPDCPDWINEGLASLFEQCGDRDGRFIGLVNWRLPILQDAIVSGRVPTWARLTDPAVDFYGTGQGEHYAAARYLLLWLQDQGLRQRFWNGWLAARVSDANGLATLLALFPGEDAAAVERRWRAWVMALRRP